MTGEHVLAVKRSLAAETAAHVGRDDANLVLRKAEPGRQIAAHAVRRLGRKPHRESLSHWLGARDDASRLDGQRDLTRAGDMHAADMLGLRKRLLHIAAFFRRDVTNIAVEFFARERCAWLKRFFCVDYRGQGFVFDLNGIGAILGQGASLRHDRCYRNADAMDGSARQHGMGWYLLARHYRRGRNL